MSETPTLAKLKEKPHYSYSAINTYLNVCQLQYYYRYVAKLEAEQTPAALPFGSAFHAAMSEQAHAARDGSLMSATELTDSFAAYLKANIDDSPRVVFKDGDNIDTLIALGGRMLAVATSEWIDFHQTIADVAVPFEFNVEGLGKPVIGEYDLLVREPTPFDGPDDQPLTTIVDWKTSARAWPDDRAAKELQATVYVASYLDNHGDSPDFRYDVVTKAKAPKVCRHYTSRNESQIMRMKRLLIEADRAIQKGCFLPNETSFSCADCPYAVSCSKWHCGLPKNVSVPSTTKAA